MIVSIISILPWALLFSGIFTHLNTSTEDILFVFPLIAVVIIVIDYKLSFKNMKTNEQSSKFRFEKTLCYLCSMVFFFIFIEVFAFLRDVDYNVLYVRNALVAQSGIVDYIFFGNEKINMLYNYVIQSIALSLLIFLPKWRFHKIILAISFISAGMILGGRFALYKLIVIILLTNESGNKKTTKAFFFILALVLMALCVQYYRSAAADPNYNIFDYLNDFVYYLYNYHSIQTPLILKAFDAPFQYGVFTGLVTPIFVVLGLKSPEGSLGDFLFSNSYHLGDVYYNAFGTSISLFTSSVGYIGILIFSVCLLCTYFLIKLFQNQKWYKALMVFFLFSLFFSAFQPYMWTTGWYVSVIFIIMYHKFFLIKVK